MPIDLLARPDEISAAIVALPALPRLDGARVRLRAIRDGEGDVDGLHEIFSDPRVMRWWSRPPMTSREEAVAYAESIREGFAQRTLFNWILADRDSDACIGTTTLYALEPRHLRADIGYALASAHWGKGLASEAVALALAFGFGALRLHRIGADVAPGNDASLRLLARHGFRLEGRLRANFNSGRELQDSLMHGLLADEWEARHAARD
ncbi:GNAT family N-acetyltransferase [Xanthomonadaceae bacterium JHOS43]|nr:GNAT family N-acetyltransferase [Xanthomonadaceae bacterium JHOS43]MCX7562111.1 GNAT family N-acetyltransferase [Xanthomonadaceae bacterium XH05]